MSNSLCALAQRKSRLKSYHGNCYYLEDEQEFQLELFNIEQTEVLVRISINGESIHQKSSGLLLKPGQRYWLERFIDDDSKLVFKTYSVENSQETKHAIKNNGEVKIEFFKKQYKSFKQERGLTHYSQTPQWLSNPLYVNHNSGSIIGGTIGNPVNGTVTIAPSSFNFSSGSTTTTTNAQLSSNNITFTNSVINSSYVTEPIVQFSSDIETGRIELGEKSEQQIDSIESNTVWNSYPSNTWVFKLLPLSQKPIETNSLVKFCSNCGTKVIKGQKFCSECGTKIN